MNYSQNNFNLSDIETIKDFNSFSEYFENNIKKRKIKDLLIGPNLINIKYPNKKKESDDKHSINKNQNKAFVNKLNNEIEEDFQNEENPKLINTFCQMIINMIQDKKEQTIILNSCSNFSSKNYLKRLLRELDNIVEEREHQKKLERNQNISSGIENINQSSEFNQQLLRSILFVDFFAIFTSLKTNQNEEIPITDYLIDFYDTNGILKFGSLTNFQLNTNYIYNKGQELNNLNIFYMMLYNLPEEDLFDNLFCDQTHNFFGIFDPNLPLEDHVRRYIFASQFSILRNNQQFDSFAKSNNNVNLIKKEYDFYRNLFNSYLSTKEYLGIDIDNEKKIFEVFYSILLLSEFDPFKLPIVNSLIKKINSERKPIYQKEILNFISDHLKVEENKNALNKNGNKDPFGYSQNKFNKNEKWNQNDLNNFDSNISILKKLSLHLDLQIERIIYLLIIETTINENINVLSEKNSNYLRARNHLIKIIYLVFIDKIENLFNLIENKDFKKFYIYIAHSNLVHNDTFLSPFRNENDNFFIDKYVKETIISNYIQEIKNFSIFQNSLKFSIFENDENFPSIKLNEKYLSGLFNQTFNFFNILELYENEEFGLLKLTKDVNLIENFKNFYLNKFSNQRNSFFEILKSNIIKIKHTFGVFYYDLNELEKEFQFSIKAYSISESYFKFIGYRINDMSYETRVIENLDFSTLANFTNEIIYVNYLIKVGSYSFRAILDDFKLFYQYNFFSKFFVYVFDINSLREIIRTNKRFQNIFHYLNLNDFDFFKKTYAKKINISQIDYSYEKGFVLLKNSYNSILDENKLYANFIYKYDLEMFLVLKSKKLMQPNFSRFKHIVNSVKSYLRFTKIYQEKKVFRIIKNCLLDLILENYNTINDLDSQQEFTFDFEKESVSKLLPKLHSNLNQLKKIWKNYMDDILYLDYNKNTFQNSLSVEDIIKERLASFQMLIFLFSKKYNFINFEIIRKNGILHYEFTKSILSDTINLISKHFYDLKDYLAKNNFKIQNKELINMKILALKRLSIKDQQRKSLLENSEDVPKISDNNQNNNKKSNLNINTDNMQSFGYEDGIQFKIPESNKNNKLDESNNDILTPTKENNFSFRSIDIEDNINNINTKKRNETNPQDSSLISDSGTRVNLKLLNNKLQYQDELNEYSVNQPNENKRRFTNLILGKENIEIKRVEVSNPNIDNSLSVTLTEERKEILLTNTSKDVSNSKNNITISNNSITIENVNYKNSNNYKRKNNAQKYINDGIINQILNFDDKKNLDNDNADNIKFSERNLNKNKDSVKAEKELELKNLELMKIQSRPSTDLKFENFKLNENLKINESNVDSRSNLAFKPSSNGESRISNFKQIQIEDRSNSIISKRESLLSCNMDENEDISSNKFIEYINSEGEPIRKSQLLSKQKTSIIGLDIPMDISNDQNPSKSKINKIKEKEANKDFSIIKFENKILVSESRYAILYNPENGKQTSYLSDNKNDFTDLNDIRNQKKFLEIKNKNSEEFFVKPRLSNKKNISSFLNTDSSNNNPFRLNTEANAADLNINNHTILNIISHSNTPEFIPDFKNYAIEKNFNILIVDQKSIPESISSKSIGENNIPDFKNYAIEKNYNILINEQKRIPESLSSKSIGENNNDFRIYKKENIRKSNSELSFEKENDFTLLAHDLMNLKEEASIIKENSQDEEVKEKEISNEYINLNELKNLDETLDLLKKKIAALEMWKTVNESTGKLCLGDIILDLNLSLDDTNENSEFFNEIMNQLNNAETILKKNSIFDH